MTDLERLFELSTDLMCLAGTDGYFKRVNPSFVRILGYTAEELLSRPYLEFVHPDDRQVTVTEATGIADSGLGSVRFDNRYICKDGSIRWLAWQSTSAPENGHIYATARDVTEQKLVEQKLLRSEALARATLDGVYGALPQIVWTSDPDGNLDYYNQRWFDYTGMTLEQTKGWGWGPVLHPDDLQACVETWTAAVESGELYEIEYRFKRASDGTYRWHLGRALPIRDLSGQVVKWFGTCTDIHDQKRALEASIAAENRFRSIVEQSPFATQLLAVDGRVLKVNRAWQALWSVPDDVVSSFILKEYNALADPILAKLGIDQSFAKSLVNGAQVIKGVYYDPTTVGQAGRPRWVDAYFNPVKDAAGTVTEVILLFNDVTETKLAADAVQAHQERLQSILDNTPDVIFVKDLEGRVLVANHQYEAVFGLNQDQIIGRTDHDLFPKALADKFVENDQTVLRTGQPVRQEELAPHPDGLHTYHSVKFPIRNREGRTVAVGGIASDVTEQKRVETERARLREREQAASAVEESEARLRAIFDSSFDAIVGIDADGMLTDWNPQAEKIFGWKLAEVVGRRLSEIIIPEVYRVAHDNGMKHFLATGEGPVLNQSIEIEAIRKSGEVFPVQLAVSPIRMKSGYTFTAFISDITERKRTTDALKALVDSSPLATVVTGRDGNLVLWNPAAERIFGWRADEVLGKPLPYERAERQAETAAKLLAGAKLIGVEATRLKKGGAEIIVNLSAVPLMNSKNEAYGVLAVMSDITEQKKGEAELINARDLADKATRAKSDFLANMSHEIRTPINGVIGMTGLLLDTKLDPEQREYAETVRLSADMLLTVINDILDFSKIEAGKLDIESVTFNIDDLIHNIERNLAFSARSKGLKLLKSATAENAVTAFKGDPARIGQVLTNLVNNAIKFTKEGHVIIDVGQAAEGPNRVRLRFEITDTGIGIPEASIARMFKAFSQADGSTSRRYGGTGLGLSISKQLVELMGGEIGVKSAEGKGSTFWFTLVLEPAAPTAENDSVAQVAPLSAGPRPTRILLAEDNRVNQLIAVRILEKAGYRVDAVANGMEAFDALRVAPYDLVLMDCQMPELDGYSATEMIRSSPTLKARNIPIVAMTANAMAGDRERCLQVGMNDYVSKPVRAAELVAVIQRSLAQSGMLPR